MNPGLLQLIFYTTEALLAVKPKCTYYLKIVFLLFVKLLTLVKSKIDILIKRKKKKHILFPNY